MDNEYKTRHIQTKSYLKTHIKTVHEKRREHACPYCPGVAFGTNSYLTKHINLVHLKLREHACPYIHVCMLYCPGVAYQTDQHPEEAHRCGPLEDQAQQRCKVGWNAQ